MTKKRLYFVLEKCKLYGDTNKSEKLDKHELHPLLVMCIEAPHLSLILYEMNIQRNTHNTLVPEWWQQMCDYSYRMQQ